jgi:hypothetical protein
LKTHACVCLEMRLQNCVRRPVLPHSRLSGIQVRDPSGEHGFYIPYIYLTNNDAALASGREVLVLQRNSPRRLTAVAHDAVGRQTHPTGGATMRLHQFPNISR